MMKKTHLYLPAANEVFFCFKLSPKKLVKKYVGSIFVAQKIYPFNIC